MTNPINLLRPFFGQGERRLVRTFLKQARNELACHSTVKTVLREINPQERLTANMMENGKDLMISHEKNLDNGVNAVRKYIAGVKKGKLENNRFHVSSDKGTINVALFRDSLFGIKGKLRSMLWVDEKHGYRYFAHGNGNGTKVKGDIIREKTIASNSKEITTFENLKQAFMSILNG